MDGSWKAQAMAKRNPKQNRTPFGVRGTLSAGIARRVSYVVPKDKPIQPPRTADCKEKR